jgi:hypothetical protein
MRVHIGHYTHKHGEDICVYAAAEDAEAARQAIAADWWQKELGDRPKPNGSKATADEYFEIMSDRGEYFSIQECEVEGAAPVAADSPPDAPAFAVIVDGGMVQDVVATNPAFVGMTYVTIDYDLEGLGKDDMVRDVPKDGGEEAYCRVHRVSEAVYDLSTFPNWPERPAIQD